MTYKKLSKTARIRKMLDQGKSVKQIVSALGCTPQMVYLTRSNMKKAERRAFQNEMQNKANAALAAHAEQHAKEYQKTIIVKRGEAARQAREDAIRKAIQTMQPVSKPGVLKRIANWIMGA